MAGKWLESGWITWDSTGFWMGFWGFLGFLGHKFVVLLGIIYRAQGQLVL